MSGTTTSTTPVVYRYSQRHVNALFSTPTHYVNKRLHAKVSTGITIEYALHTCPAPDATEDDDDEGERLVLIMGFRQSMEWWAPVIDELSATWASSSDNDPTKKKKNLTIVTFDNRGIGGTDAHWGRYTTSQMAHDTLALMDHLAWPVAHIAGVSMGGMIAMELALTASSRVKSLSLFATSRGRFVSDAPLNPQVFRTMLSSDNNVLVASVISMLHPPEFLATKLDLPGHKSKKCKTWTTIGELVFAYYTHLLEFGKLPLASGSLGQLCAVATHFVSDERLAEIGDAGLPVLIMGGIKDTLIPVRESTMLAKQMQVKPTRDDHIKLVVLEHAGHGLFVESLDDVTRELLSTIHRAMH